MGPSFVVTVSILSLCTSLALGRWDFNAKKGWDTDYVKFEGYLVTKNTSEVGFHLESPNVTDFGTWGEPQVCSEGYFVDGFQLKVEPKNSVVDDTALNGIRFFCSSGENITSKIGYFGNWGKKFSCNTYAVGFELQSQVYQGPKADDTAATNFRLLCADGTSFEGFNDNGHIFVDSYYTGETRCQPGQFLCGIQTQVERYQVFGDDTALNNVRAKCCSPLSAGAVPIAVGSLASEVPIIGVTRTTMPPRDTSAASAGQMSMENEMKPEPF